MPSSQSNTAETPPVTPTNGSHGNLTVINNIATSLSGKRGMFLSFLTLITFIVGSLSIIKQSVGALALWLMPGFFNVLGVVPSSLTSYNGAIVSLIQEIFYIMTFVITGYFSEGAFITTEKYIPLATVPLSLINLVALAGIWKLKRFWVYVYFSMFLLFYLLIIIAVMLIIIFKTEAWYSLVLIYPFITYRWGILNIVLLIAVIRKWSLFR